VTILRLEDSALVVLGAVFAVVEVLHHLVELLGHESLGGLGERLADAGVGSQTAHLTGHALDALLGLEDGAVHVLHPPHHVGQRARVCRGRMLILETHAVLLTI